MEAIIVNSPADIPQTNKKVYYFLKKSLNHIQLVARTESGLEVPIVAIICEAPPSEMHEPNQGKLVRYVAESNTFAAVGLKSTFVYGKVYRVDQV